MARMTPAMLYLVIASGTAAASAETKPVPDALFPVQANGKLGFIDRTGTVAIPARYTFAGPFRHGLARVKIGRADGYVDRKGKVVYRWSKPQLKDTDYED